MKLSHRPAGSPTMHTFTMEFDPLATFVPRFLINASLLGCWDNLMALAQRLGVPQERNGIHPELSREGSIPRGVHAAPSPRSTGRDK
jgi:hypothetical protein